MRRKNNVEGNVGDDDEDNDDHDDDDDHDNADEEEEDSDGSCNDGYYEDNNVYVLNFYM